MSDKHAYLIMAHNDFESLQYLFKAIDDIRNDIYLHIDKKTSYVDYNEIRSWVSESQLFFTPRIDVRWGHTSFTECELLLLKEATAKEQYHYYHLLSGIDYPLKSQDEIHNYLFDKNEEFISYYHNGERGEDFMYKLKYYHVFKKWDGKGVFDGAGKKAAFMRWLHEFEWKLVSFEERRGIDRTKKLQGIDIVKGDNWFSITDDFARYIVSQKRKILRDYWLTSCSDEFFVGTIAMNSQFKDRVVNTNLRLIDWDRGSPYEFCYGDKDELVASDAFFARKISYTNQPQLVKTLIGRDKKSMNPPKKDLPLISIVVPVYNVEDYLEECLISIAKQTYKNIEVLIVDDGATDGSAIIAKKYADSDNRFIYIKQKNGGLSAARNRGIDEAKGEYIAFVDSDDWVDEKYIELLYNNLIETGADVSVCGFIKESDIRDTYTYKKDEVLSRSKSMAVLGNIFPKEYLLMVVTWNKLYRKSIFDKVRFKEGKIHEDEYAIHRVIDETSMVSTMTDALYHYRVRNNSIMGAQNTADLRHFDAIEAHRDRVKCCRQQIYADIYRLIVYSLFEEIIQLMFRYDDDAYRNYHLSSRFRKLLISECIKNYDQLDNHQKKEYLMAIISPKGYVRRINRINEKG
ncbi:glycosyltransferase [Butyrivibrio sp. WCD2001]|uniref:glycosyltransferase n=1 Tax=Butyrivibrio sp. WCD2001 TaxID=1280681 RepID=UPI000402AFAA|nr:glycosyltransferase [Butyrivibrio sp. WCD2001]